MSDTHHQSDLYDYIFDRFILISPDQGFEGAKSQLLKRKGNLDWILLAKQIDGSILGCSFRDIHDWMTKHRLTQVDIEKLIKDPESPIQPLRSFEEDDLSTEEAIEIASQSPLGLFVLTWCGEVVGIFSQKPVDSPAPLPGKAVQLAEKSGFSRIKDLISKSSGHYKRLRNSIIIAILSSAFAYFLAYVQLSTTNFSEVFPSLFPPVMTGEWNVVVSGFTPVGEQSVSSKQAKYISDVFFGHFKTEMDALADETGVNIEVIGPGKTARISGGTSDDRSSKALELARKTKADIVIYGTIKGSTNGYLLLPEFYVNVRNFHEAEEVTGQHSLGKPINIQWFGDELATQIILNRELSRRSRVLALISKGLGMYLSHLYEDSLDLFVRANDGQLWELNDGREVIYLFEGNAAGKAQHYSEAEEYYKKALELNPEYSRAYAGLGSVYYTYSIRNISGENFLPDQEYLDKALNYYQSALLAADQPLSADIPIKVSFGKGQVYLVRWLAGEDTLDQAREEFNFVIKEFENEHKTSIQEQASEAHARLGLIYRQEGNIEQALEEYKIAVTLSANPERRAIHWYTIGDIYEMQGNSTESISAYEGAIQEYSLAINLTTQSERRAEYWSRIADCYEKMGDEAQLKQALTRAINSLPLDSKEREEVERRLQQLSN